MSDMRVVTSLLVFGVKVAAKRANARGSESFMDSIKSAQAGADVRRYGAEKAALAYGARQEMDRWLFVESLSSIVAEGGKPSSDQIANVIGSHRRRWRD